MIALDAETSRLLLARSPPRRLEGSLRQRRPEVNRVEANPGPSGAGLKVDAHRPRPLVDHREVPQRERERALRPMGFEPAGRAGCAIDGDAHAVGRHILDRLGPGRAAAVPVVAGVARAVMDERPQGVKSVERSGTYAAVPVS